MADAAARASRGRGLFDGRLVIVALVVLAGVVAVFVWRVRSSNSEPNNPAAAPTADGLGVEDFAARVAAEDVVVINVHVPYEGEIEGTDLFVRFDRIGTDPQVPDDRGAPIALYCRTGRMSQQAAATLAGQGYTNVVELDGGMLAWQQTGRQIMRHENAGSASPDAAEQPSSLRRPGEETGETNPGGFVVLALLVLGWIIGFAVVMRRGRRARTPAASSS